MGSHCASAMSAASAHPCGCDNNPFTCSSTGDAAYTSHREPIHATSVPFTPETCKSQIRRQSY